MANQDLKIAIGSDHRGYRLKEEIKEFLNSTGIATDDLGTDNDESVDYPDFAIAVAQKVSEGKCQFGILICHTGIGMSMAAGKVHGIRPALCRTPEDAHAARAHNNGNLLVIGARDQDIDSFQKLWQEWINTEFEGGRHKRRVDKITFYEDRTPGR